MYSKGKKYAKKTGDANGNCFINKDFPLWELSFNFKKIAKKIEFIINRITC